MAGFAADAVGGLEARAALCPAGVAWQPRHIGRGRGLADAEPLRDHLAARLAQHRIGAAVRAGRRRRILPDHQLVLADDGAVGLAAAVAGRAAAGRDADKVGAVLLRDRRRAERPEQHEQERGHEARRAQPDGDVAAAPHLPSMPPPRTRAA